MALSQDALVACVTCIVAAQAASYATHFAAQAASTKYRTFSAYEKNYFCTTVVSGIHALIVHILGWPFLAANPTWLSTASIEDTHPDIYLLNYIFIGYVASDLRFVLPWAVKLRKPDDLAFVMHHVCILMTWYSFLADDWGHLFALCTILTEMTQINVGLRWIMHQWGWSSHPLYLANGLAMLFGWWYFRIYGYVLFLGWRLVELRGDLLADSDHYARNGFVFVCWILGSGLQLMWGYKITVGAAKALTGGKKKKGPEAEDTKKK